ncbi:hypothetical protein ACHWQZ_G011773 [Mnemiopsis leidyi]
MDVYIMIRRKKTTILTDAKESSTVAELKTIIEGLLKCGVDDQRLLLDGLILEDAKTLSDSGITAKNAQAMNPVQLTLSIRKDSDGEFEEEAVEPYSVPPELPEALKQQDPAC